MVHIRKHMSSDLYYISDEKLRVPSTSMADTLCAADIGHGLFPGFNAMAGTVDMLSSMFDAISGMKAPVTTLLYTNKTAFQVDVPTCKQVVYYYKDNKDLLNWNIYMYTM